MRARRAARARARRRRSAAAGRTPCCAARAGRRRKPRPPAGSPSSSAAAVTAARASPGSNRCSTATATTASPRKSSAAPCPQPSARRRARTSQARSAARRSRGRSAVPADRGLPAPIAAARAISSEVRVAPTGATPADRSVHSFHSSILRSIDVIEQWDARPNRRSSPERLLEPTIPRRCAKDCGQKRCLFPALNEAACAALGPPAALAGRGSLNASQVVCTG